jgi:ubiquinone biosynthesis protein UbiJ
MFSQTLTAGLEIIINKVLTLKSAFFSFDKLAHKTLTIALSELDFPLSFTVVPTKESRFNTMNVLVTSLTAHTDCTITTSIKTLIELQTQKKLTELIKQDKLDVTGDIKVAQQFASLAETLNIDWQSELATHIGDIPTHKLTQLGKKVSDKFHFTAQQIKADASEYLVHEQRVVVTKSQIELFNQAVADIDAQTQTLEARIARLSEHLPQ